MNLADYRVERVEEPSATAGAAGTASGAKAGASSTTVIKLVPTSEGVSRTYELRVPAGEAGSTPEALDAWVAAFTAQISSAVAASGFAAAAASTTTTTGGATAGDAAGVTDAAPAPAASAAAADV